MNTNRLTAKKRFSGYAIYFAGTDKLAGMFNATHKTINITNGKQYIAKTLQEAKQIIMQNLY